MDNSGVASGQSALTLLESLRGTPSIRQVFSYNALLDNCFRIFKLERTTRDFRIKGQISDYNLRNPPPYYALSYVWGPEPPVHPIFVNDSIVMIQPNLFHALSRLRRTESEVFLWIDSLCINQQNLGERSMQVQRMAEIFGNASGVFIWLGEEDFSSGLALDFIDEIVKSNFQWQDAWINQHGLAALVQLMDRPWFRRGWVLQEAAFAKTSILHCGDRQVHVDHFKMAVDLIQAQFSAMRSSFGEVTDQQALIIANFQNAPAIKVLQTIESVFQKSVQGEIVVKNMSLEELVDHSTFSQTTDHRDTIYSLLSMANDTSPPPCPILNDTADSFEEEVYGFIVPDYSKDVLDVDVFVDFVTHCCLHSSSLDVICRPWAPAGSSMTYPFSRTEMLRATQSYPSWIARRDSLPFGDPAVRSTRRLHGNPLVRIRTPLYRAHGLTTPRMLIEFDGADGTYGWLLTARGILLGTIANRSGRMVNAVITRENISLLGELTSRAHSNVIEVPDSIWRTLCANRDEEGRPAPSFFRVALQSLLQTGADGEFPANPQDDMAPIDIEELLEDNLADHVKRFLMVVRDVVWNRRTFRGDSHSLPNPEPLVGLIPPSAVVGDTICILYGCSAPVILRRISRDPLRWKLIGNAYVHGLMDGDAISLGYPEDSFGIR